MMINIIPPTSDNMVHSFLNQKSILLILMFKNLQKDKETKMWKQ